ncbi:MAG: radical SAM family heme chaperone HemW [Betaproteobacteria bacterium]
MPKKSTNRVIPIIAQGQNARPVDKGLAFRHAVPLSLYVHIPWCVQKCPYCDFNSHEAREDIPEDSYIAALIADLESALPLIWGRNVSSIFFGGGTPSLLSGAGMKTLISDLRARLPMIPGAEITLEANPGTVESEKFAAFRDAGVNRLSLGIQSFNPTHLKALGRIHDDTEARKAIAIATRHFDNFNLDLMYGLPGQTLEQAIDDVEQALTFAPTHISCYQLTLEPNTAFAATPPALPDPDCCADMQEAIEARLAAAGFTHYETSAFAQPDRQCRHNLNYWTFGDYLGIGAGAHSKLTSQDQVLRQMRWKQPKQYLAKIGSREALQEEFSVSADDLPFEFMMNALRLNQGFDAALFEMRTSLPLQCIESTLRQAEKDGLIERSIQRIAPTHQGQRFLNRLLERFLSDPD